MNLRVSVWEPRKYSGEEIPPVARGWRSNPIKGFRGGPARFVHLKVKVYKDVGQGREQVGEGVICPVLLEICDQWISAHALGCVVIALQAYSKTVKDKLRAVDELRAQLEAIADALRK